MLTVQEIRARLALPEDPKQTRLWFVRLADGQIMDTFTTERRQNSGYKELTAEEVEDLLNQRELETLKAHQAHVDELIRAREQKTKKPARA